MITNTHSVGVVRDAVIAYQVKQGSVGPTANLWSLPLVAETWDGYLTISTAFTSSRNTSSQPGQEHRPAQCPRVTSAAAPA